MPKVTQEFVDSLRPRDYKQVFFDDNEKWFGIRVYPTGRKCYVIRYRLRNCTHLKVIANSNAMEVDRAREFAKSQLQLALQGL